jgi:8-oxo-dGTP pyrophosphatase MutT (NUDIX family)
MTISFPHPTNHYDARDHGCVLVAPENDYRNRPSVYALVYNDEGMIASIVYRKEVGRLYPLPGGGLESGESYEEAVIREVREEVGCEITDIEFLGSFSSFDSISMRCFQSVICSAKLVGEPVLPNPTEEYEQGAQLVWKSLEKIQTELQELAEPVEKARDDRSYMTLEILSRSEILKVYV